MQVIPGQMMFATGSLVCASIGSFHDMRERRIPNLVTGPAIVFGLVAHLVWGGWGALGNATLAGLIAGGSFFLFFVAGGMGAGDVKLMAAVGCWVGLSPLRLVLLSTVIAGGLFALGVSIYKGRLREILRNTCSIVLHHQQQGLRVHPELNLSNSGTLRLPYALPIMAGCLFSLCTLAWEAWS
jgi:prepilin peptidase CpaA